MILKNLPTKSSKKEFFSYNFIGETMNLYKTIQNFLFDQKYSIEIWDKYIHVFRFIDIITLNETLIILNMENFNLEIKGDEFKVLKLTKNEILINGNLKEMRIAS